MSPRRPTIGVATEALRRNAVSTQPMALSEVWSDFCISGRAGTTSDWSKAYEMPPSERTVRMIREEEWDTRRMIGEWYQIIGGHKPFVAANVKRMRMAST